MINKWSISWYLNVKKFVVFHVLQDRQLHSIINFFILCRPWFFVKLLLLQCGLFSNMLIFQFFCLNGLPCQIQSFCVLVFHSYFFWCLFCSVLWWPTGRHDKIVSIDEQNLFLWSLDASKKTAQVLKLSHSVIWLHIYFYCVVFHIFGMLTAILLELGHTKVQRIYICVVFTYGEVVWNKQSYCRGRIYSKLWISRDSQKPILDSNYTKP